MISATLPCRVWPVMAPSYQAIGGPGRRPAPAGRRLSAPVSSAPAWTRSPTASRARSWPARPRSAPRRGRPSFSAPSRRWFRTSTSSSSPTASTTCATTGAGPIPSWSCRFSRWGWPSSRRPSRAGRALRDAVALRRDRDRVPHPLRLGDVLRDDVLDARDAASLRPRLAFHPRPALHRDRARQRSILTLVLPGPRASNRDRRLGRARGLRRSLRRPPCPRPRDLEAARRGPPPGARVAVLPQFLSPFRWLGLSESGGRDPRRLLRHRTLREGRRGPAAAEAVGGGAAEPLGLLPAARAREGRDATRSRRAAPALEAARTPRRTGRSTWRSRGFRSRPSTRSRTEERR